MTAPSRTPCLVAQAFASASDMKISGLLHAFAKASSAVTQSPWSSLPQNEIFCRLHDESSQAPPRRWGRAWRLQAHAGRRDAPRLPRRSGMCYLQSWWILGAGEIMAGTTRWEARRVALALPTLRSRSLSSSTTMAWTFL